MLSLRAKAKLKKQIFLVRISIQKRVGGRIFFFLLFQTFFIISNWMLSLHIITLSQLEYLGQILIKWNVRY